MTCSIGYLAATAHLGDDHIIVRATADNPLYCPEHTTKIFSSFRPAGQITHSREPVLRGSGSDAGSAHSRHGGPGHVAVLPRARDAQFSATPRRNSASPRLSPTWKDSGPEVRLTVDTPEELERMAAIYGALGPGDGPMYSLEQVYEFSERRPLVS